MGERKGGAGEGGIEKWRRRWGEKGGGALVGGEGIKKGFQVPIYLKTLSFGHLIF